MPLVVPGITSQGGNDKTSDWMNKLMGKKIGDNSNETVSGNDKSLDSDTDCGPDLCEDGSAKGASCRQGRRHADDGSQAREASLFDLGDVLHSY